MPPAWHQPWNLLPLEKQIRRHGSVDLRMLREVQEKNDKLKKMFANLSLENAALKDLIVQKGW